MKKYLSPRVRSVAVAGTLLVCGGLAIPFGVFAGEGDEAKDPKAPKDTTAEPAEKDAKEEKPEAAEKAPLEERLEAYQNWVEFSFGGLTLDGNRGAFQQRYQTPKGGFGGIEDFHYSTSVDKKTTLKLDARTMLDNQDYRAKVDVTREDLGFLRGGMSYYRTWYDGSGGFYPATGAWYDLYDDALALDRGEVWVEGGLTLKDLPTLTFKYSHQIRDGQKDSTSWGYTHPYGAGPVRGISPSFYDIDEERDTFQADLRHTLGKFKVGAGFRYDGSDSDNARKIHEYPNEASDRYVTHRETVSSDAWSAHAFAENQLHKKVLFTTGYSFSSLDTDLGGSRVYGNDYDVQFNSALAQGLGFYGLTGGSQLQEHTANLNLLYTPWENLTLVPSIRIQHTGSDSDSYFTQTMPGSEVGMDGSSEREVFDLTEQLELKYSGVTNWVFYARGEFNQADGDLTEVGGGGLVGPVDHYVEDSRSGQKYTVGANWYPSRNVHVDAQYYRKMRDTDYDHENYNNPGSGNRYPGFIASQDFTTDDANVRLTLRPHQKVTLVTRYDYQISHVDTAPVGGFGLNETETGKITSHIIAQNITYVPWSRLYLQGGFNCVFSSSETPMESYSQAVLESNNNYWSGSLTAGFVVDDKTDLQANYFYFRAFDNYTDNSAYGVPYGSDAKEHAITAGLTRRLRDNIRLGLKYGFFQYRDGAAGGHNDYDSHMVYSSLQIRF